MFRADWNWWSNSRSAPVRDAPPQELVTPDGSCAPVETAPRGIGLGMTECDLVRLAGPFDQIDLGANERGERTAVLTYARGERAGVYRFTSGLLTVIEAPPEPVRPQRPQRRQSPRRN
jgi:hypothetical protein